ncbi:MAG: type IV pilus modification PilV family protein [Thermogutta sp.]
MLRGKRKKTAKIRFQPPHNSGFTLLEVILAIAILLSSLAAIGQLVYNAYQNALRVKNLTRAQLICESILAELNAGSIFLETIADAPVEDIDDTVEPGWLYSIDVAQLDTSGLLSVQVTVSQDPSLVARPVQFTLTQWMIDPTMEFVQPGETSSFASGGSVPGS